MLCAPAVLISVNEKLDNEVQFANIPVKLVAELVSTCEKSAYSKEEQFLKRLSIRKTLSRHKPVRLKVLTLLQESKRPLMFVRLGVLMLVKSKLVRLEQFLKNSGMYFTEEKSICERSMSFKFVQPLKNSVRSTTNFVSMFLSSNSSKFLQFLKRFFMLVTLLVLSPVKSIFFIFVQFSKSPLIFNKLSH